ncbi:fluoride efflux transporter FluC [Paenisporosarcina indica]|uniref:fluoride efflux transporter FluC n=1 Tax=Paenisporosarcina indica TaxID=650093 RepID=UPI001FE2A59B|nr:CrcB family protein [Paenisporosarcina indica]
MGERIVITIIAVAAGGFLGAIVRYLVSMRVTGMLGILSVNILGSFLFGLSLRFVDEAGTFSSFWLIGFLGAFTTFSTFAVQFVETWNDGHSVKAISYALVTLIGGLLFVCMGWIFSGFILIK